MKTLTAKEKKRSNQQFPVNLSWQYVFNGSLVGWGHIDSCANAAIEMGYEYITWNNRVYYLDGMFASSTGIVVNKDGTFRYDINMLSEHWIGKKVSKVSGKPFKSGEHTATIKGVLRQNTLSKEPSQDKPAFTFEEDESIVECLKCRRYE